MKFKFLIVFFFTLIFFQDISSSQIQKVRIEIKDKFLIAEIAATDEEQSEGLMNRSSLGKNEGMLFIFEEGSNPCFWMKDTTIPLSLAFIDKENKIVKIVDMTPLSLTEHCSGQPVNLALEVNQGWFQQNNIRVGEKILSIKRVN
ncbi:MAG: DUF192 domain-containing protein [Candidatus Fonsibacter sp.]|jgi:uncharacterized membrane protein (UPF0127 family)|nr:DUF192 domain-containing protein [Pelagibacterales bacterium]